MAAVKKALEKVGIKGTPVNHRVWQFLKDSGTHNANAVAVALKLPANNVSSTLGQLRDRGMVTSKVEQDRLTGRNVHYYTTVANLKTWALLPFTAEAKARPRRQHPTPRQVSGMHDLGTAHLPAAVPPPVTPTPHILDRLSVRDAYALYLELKGMFNPVKAAA